MTNKDGSLGELLLRARRPEALAYRAWFSALKKSGWAKRRFPARPPDPAEFLRHLSPDLPSDLASFARHFDSRPGPRFFAAADGTEPVGRLRSVSPTLLEQTEDITKLRFSSCGSPIVQFERTVDWHHALVSQNRWPCQHWTQIDYRNLGHLGDIKACWEWNRHRCFVTLGRAFRATGDDKHVELFVRLLESWCIQNPPEVGIHYISNLELGLRCLSWLWAHSLVAPSQRYSSDARSLLHLNVFYMARHIARNLNYSRFTARNNHLIGDAACLAMIAIMYPELSIARQWRQRSLKELWAALRRQMRPDGLHFEVSFGYHRFVTELVVQVLLLCEINQIAVPTDIPARLERMIEVLGEVMLPDRSLPNLNDEDSGSALPLDDDSGDCRLLLGVGASLVDRSDWKALAGPLPEAAFWLLGSRRAGAVEDLPPGEPGAREAALRPSGIYVMRSSWSPRADHALVDNHPDPFPQSGHSHAASLHLLLAIEGKPLLLDGGTYRYGASGGFRNPLRSTAAHNTVEVDGTGQAIPRGTFGWASSLRPGRTDWHADDDHVLFDGTHEAYRRLRQPVRHRRIVLWLRQHRVWLVADMLDGRGTHRFDQRWHVAAQSFTSVPKDAILRLRLDGAVDASLSLGCNPDDTTTVHTGDPAVAVSWHSRTYGNLEPRTTLTRTWVAEVPTERTTLFAASPAVSAEDLAVERCEPGRLRLPGLSVDLVFDETSAHVEVL